MKIGPIKFPCNSFRKKISCTFTLCGKVCTEKFSELYRILQSHILAKNTYVNDLADLEFGTGKVSPSKKRDLRTYCTPHYTT